jgi:hypothetical protein
MMKSEALRNIKTMRQIRNSLNAARSEKLRTSNSLSRSREELEHLESLTDSRLEQILAKERERARAFDTSVEKSRQRLIKSREKLAATINKNRALTDLRHQLQRARWDGNDPTLPKVDEPSSRQKLHQMELRY